MPNQELLNYIKEQHAKGIGNEAIRNVLLQAGWQENDVAATFAALTSNTSPIQSISMQSITPAESRQHLEQGIMPQTQASFPSDRLASPSELLTFAWKIFAKRWKTLIGIQLLAFLMFTVPILVLTDTTLTNINSQSKTSTLNSSASILNTPNFSKSFMLNEKVTTQQLSTVSPTLPSFSPKTFIMFGIAMIPALFVYLWAHLAMIYVIKNREEGVGIKAAFGRARKKILPFIGVSLLVGASVMTGYMLLFIPGIIFAVWFCLSPYALVYEDSGVLGALLTSRSLTRSHKLAIFGRLIILGLCFMIPTAILGALIGIGSMIDKNAAQLINLVTTLILQLVTPAFMMVYIVGIYESLKAVKGDVSIVITTKAKAFFVIASLVGSGFFILLLGAPLILLSVNPVSQLAKVRDTTRNSDMRYIQNALNRVYVVNGTYPTTLDELIPEEMLKIPTDPKTYEPYTYQVQNNRQDYELCATLEANNKGVICVTADSSSNTPSPIIESTDSIVPEN